MSRGLMVVLVVIAVAAIAAPAATAGKAYRFKASVTAYQEVGWNQTLHGEPHCGAGGNYWRYKGFGAGTLRVTARRRKVKFVESDGALISSQFGGLARVDGDAYWDTTLVQRRENCARREPIPFETSECGLGPNNRPAALYLFVIGGRLQLNGNAVYKRGENPCDDPTTMTAQVGYAGRARGKGIAAKIRNRKRKKIVLVAGSKTRDRTLGLDDLAEPATTDEVAGGGSYKAYYRVVLRRIRRRR